MTFEEFKASLPDSVVSDKETFLSICKAAKIDIPLGERFYIKKHTPKKSRFNLNPSEVEYVVIPHPLGGRDFWVRKEDFSSLLDEANRFKNKVGL